MSALNNLLLTFEDREGAVCALADVAAVYREQGADAAVCPYIHGDEKAVSWGSGRHCADCALPVLPASYWHKLLVSVLRAARWTDTPQEVAA